MDRGPSLRERNAYATQCSQVYNALRLPKVPRFGLVPPEPFKPPLCQRGISRGVLDVGVTQVSLQRPRIDPAICEGKAAGMAQHVGMDLDPEVCG